LSVNPLRTFPRIASSSSKGIPSGFNGTCAGVWLLQEDRSSYTKYYVAECERLENNVKTVATLFKVDSKAYGSCIASPNNTSLPPWEPRTSSETAEYPAASEGGGQGIFSGLMHALAAPFSSCFDADEILAVETPNDKMRKTSDGTLRSCMTSDISYTMRAPASVAMGNHPAHQAPVDGNRPSNTSNTHRPSHTSNPHRYSNTSNTYRSSKTSKTHRPSNTSNTRSIL
jgi:hypothetical protein